MKRLGPDCGFTLVELLVALAILGLVVATLTTAFSFAQGSFDLLSDAAYQLNDIALTRRVLVDALSQLSGGQQPDDTTRFVGAKSGFTVVAIGPRIFGTAGSIILKVEAAERGGLELAWQDEGKTTFHRRTVATEYRALFAYYSIATNWTSNWDRIDSEPSVLRISFVRVGQEETQLTVAMPLRRVSPAVCASRPTANGCGSS